MDRYCTVGGFGAGERAMVWLGTVVRLHGEEALGWL